ncbi:MAG: hypothetical protein HYW48_04450 [Deltaproteobacteria bacterium]|nr:hypothetical protein [Deltaproteobacteria bacterium]
MRKPPPPDFLEEAAAQFPPNHLLAPSGFSLLSINEFLQQSFPRDSGVLT